MRTLDSLRRRDVVTAAGAVIAGGAAARLVPAAPAHAADVARAARVVGVPAGTGAPRRPAVSAEQRFYVTDFGAIADAETDNTEAFQAALDAAGAADGGTVFVPAPGVERGPERRLRYYRFDGHLRVPEGVVLQGPFQSPISFVDDRWEGTTAWTTTRLWGAILGITEGAGTPGGEPFISLAGPRAQLRGLFLFYPQQDPSSRDANSTPVAYPWTVQTAPGASDVLIEHCTFVNSYQGIYLNGADRHVVRFVSGQPLHRGLLVDGCRDGQLDGVYYHWIWTRAYHPDTVPQPPNDGAPAFELYALRNCTGFEFQDVTNEVCRWLQAWMVGTCFLFRGGRSGGKPDVRILVSNSDGSQQAVTVAEARAVRFRASGFGGAALLARRERLPGGAVRVEDANTGEVHGEGMVDWQNGPQPYSFAGSGAATLRCSILANSDDPGLTVQQSGGSLSILAAQFSTYGANHLPDVQMDRAASRLEIAGCQVEGGLDVEPNDAARQTLRDNRGYPLVSLHEELLRGRPEGADQTPSLVPGAELAPNAPPDDRNAHPDGLPNCVDVQFYGARVALDDNSPAFQAALDAMALEGGGTVYVGPGTYRFTGRLYMGANTTLAGNWRSQAEPTWPLADATATVFEVVGDAGAPDSDRAAFLTFCSRRTVAGVDVGGANQTVRDLVIYYPEQLAEASLPVEYPWTLRAQDAVGGWWINLFHVFLVNPYRGMDFGSVTFTLREVYAQPIRLGWSARFLVDWQRFADVHFGPYWAGPDTPIGRWIYEHGTGFEVLRADWFCLERVSVEGYGYGFRFRWLAGTSWGEGEAYGALLGVRAVRCRIPIAFEATHAIGLSVCDSVFQAASGDPTAYAVLIAGQWAKGSVLFSRCSFSGAPLVLDGPGAALFDQCSFADWAAAAGPSDVLFAVQAKAGIVSVYDSTFEGNGHCVEIGKGCLSAIVARNRSRGGFHAACPETSHCTVAGNTSI